MKKTICRTIRFMAFILIFALAFSVLGTSALHQTTVIEDHFDKKEYVGAFDEEIWSQYGDSETVLTEELVKPGKALRFDGSGVTGETVALMTDWYWEIHSCSFDLFVPKDAEWFALDFLDIDEPVDFCGDFGKHGKPMCYDSFMISPTLVFGLGTKWSDWGFASDTLADEWLSVKFAVDSDSTANLYLAPRGTAFDKSKSLRVTLSGNRSFYNSAVVFADYKFSGYMLDNLVVNTDTGIYRENFDDDKNDLLQTVTIIEDDTKYDFPIVDVGGSRKLAFKKASAEDRLIANTEIDAQDENLKKDEMVLSAAFSADFPASEKGELAYVFGLEESDSDPFCDSWAFIMGRGGCRFSRFDEDGKESVKKTVKNAAGGRYLLTLTKGGTLTVTQSGKQILKIGGVNAYRGYTGFAAKTDIVKVAYIDEVTIQNQIYHVVTTKSFADDFSKNRLGTFGNSDYAWYAEYGSINVSDGELIFSGCIDNTYFGPAYEYETYEMTFKLTGIQVTDKETEIQSATYADRWIGFDFGKKNSTVKSYGSYGMAAIRVTPAVGVAADKWKTADSFLYKIEGGSPLQKEEVVKVKPIPASLFKDISYDGKKIQRSDISANAAVCFKMVGLKDRVDLYMKRADAKDYTLYYSVRNVDPSGYVALTCTGYTYWSIDDFEIKNTAKFYNEAPEVIIEEIKLKTLSERGVGIEDTGYAEEKKLNANRAKPIPIIVYIGGGIAVLLVAGGVIWAVLRKKKRKSVGEGGAKQ